MTDDKPTINKLAKGVKFIDNLDRKQYLEYAKNCYTKHGRGVILIQRIQDDIMRGYIEADKILNSGDELNEQYVEHINNYNPEGEFVIYVDCEEEYNCFKLVKK